MTIHLYKPQIHLPRKELVSLVEKEGHNTFITFIFIKKDGTERKLTGLMDVKKYLKGGKATVDLNKFFIVWEVANKDYRAVNKETIKEVHMKGKQYIVKADKI